MRSIKIVTVCGSGTVGSAILATRLGELLKKYGYITEITGSSPDKIQEIDLEKYDLVVYISPVDVETTVPMLNGTGFLLGINSEEFMGKCLDIVGKLELYED